MNDSAMWWLNQNTGFGNGMQLKIGPLELLLIRYPLEWHMAWRSESKLVYQNNYEGHIKSEYLHQQGYKTRRFLA